MLPTFSPQPLPVFKYVLLFGRAHRAFHLEVRSMSCISYPLEAGAAGLTWFWWKFVSAGQTLLWSEALVNWELPVTASVTTTEWTIASQGREGWDPTNKEIYKNIIRMMMMIPLVIILYIFSKSWQSMQIKYTEGFFFYFVVFLLRRYRSVVEWSKCKMWIEVGVFSPLS